MSEILRCPGSIRGSMCHAAPPTKILLSSDWTVSTLAQNMTCLCQFALAIQPSLLHRLAELTLHQRIHKTSRTRRTRAPGLELRFREYGLFKWIFEFVNVR